MSLCPQGFGSSAFGFFCFESLDFGESVGCCAILGIGMEGVGCFSTKESSKDERQEVSSGYERIGRERRKRCAVEIFQSLKTLTFHFHNITHFSYLAYALARLRLRVTSSEFLRPKQASSKQHRRFHAQTHDDNARDYPHDRKKTTRFRL